MATALVPEHTGPTKLVRDAPSGLSHTTACCVDFEIQDGPIFQARQGELRRAFMHRLQCEDDPCSPHVRASHPILVCRRVGTSRCILREPLNNDGARA